MACSLKDELMCSVCLNIYTDPVMMKCGHNFCRVCIDGFLNTQRYSKAFSCPNCRRTFKRRPFLQRNITLCNIVDSLQSTQPDKNDAGICCTYCVDTYVPAVKSCLLCEAFLCDRHVKVHSKSSEHVLMDPTTSMESKKCPVHKKILEYYCTQDSVCICVSCSLAGEHEGHKVELLDVVSEEKKKNLKDVQENLTSDREEVEKRILGLKDHRAKGQEKATILIQCLTTLIGEFKEKLTILEETIPMMILQEKKKFSLSVSELVQQLEMEKDELSRKICQIEELCSISDPITILKDQLLCVPHKTEHETSFTKEADDVRKVGDLDLTIVSALLHTAIDNFSTGAERGGFCSSKILTISLDVNTAGNDLAISEDLKTVSWLGMGQHHLRTLKSFQSCQVLSLTSFASGKHYWEVGRSEVGDCCIGVSYASIERQGEQCIIGENDKSWGLRIWGNQYSAIHNSKLMALSSPVTSDRLAVYLDYEAGQLSFYELQVPMTLLHTFRVTFTEPLHVLCWVMGGWMEFSAGSAEKELN